MRHNPEGGVMGRKRITIEIDTVHNYQVGRAFLRQDILHSEVAVLRIEDVPEEREKVTEPIYPPIARFEYGERIPIVEGKIILVSEEHYIVCGKGDTLTINKFPKEPTPPAPESLKPCPFCGGEAMFGGRQIDKDGVANSHGTYRVFCAVCSTSDGNPYSYHNNKQLAINGWNRRTP